MTEITVAVGDASQWRGKADFVFTHPYAALPRQLHGLPMLLNLFHPEGEAPQIRRQQTTIWCGGILRLIGVWGHGLRNSLYCVNLPVRPVTIRDLVVDPFIPGVGWFPLALPQRLMEAYADHLPAGAVVWDGFCGRGTVGKVCLERGLSYVGLDIDPERVALTKRFLGLAS